MKVIIISFVLFLISAISFAQQQSSQKTNNAEEFVVNITATNNPKDIVEVKFAYAFGDSLIYPDLKLEMIKTPFTKKYHSKSFEGLIQNKNKNEDIRVSISVSLDGKPNTSSTATGRIVRIYRGPKSCGVAVF